MKRFFALLLALALLVPTLGVVTGSAAGQVTQKPFVGLTWSALDVSLFSNLAYAPIINVVNPKDSDGNAIVSEFTFSGLNGNYAAYARNMKTKLDALPEGMRYIRIFKPSYALRAGAESVIYLDNGANQLKTMFTAFVEAYYAIGGKLDGIILDTEYTALGNWYIYRDVYYGGNKNIYSDIVDDPRYLTEVRPLLEERGFAFHTPETVSGKPERSSELYSIWPKQYLTGTNAVKYANCQAIWNIVMKNRIHQYLTESIYEPAAEYYPDVTVSDYQTTDTYAWHKILSSDGAMGYLAGNGTKTGNVSNYNVYSGNPAKDFFVDGGIYLYQNPAGYNKANFEDDPYNMLMWNINKFKNMYAATDTKKINVWIAEYDYNDRAGSLCNTPYYTESLFHLGMLDPQPFLVYMYDGASKFKGTAGKAEYKKRMQVISQILNELTRLAGYSDRKPIETPASWNDGFVLSGIYANGRNLWRLTPDTTDGATLGSFKIKDNAPTFSMNGTTITFPQGRIISDSNIDVVGTCGYWIETPANVMPVTIREADRYSAYPSFMEDFENYTAGTAFSASTALPVQAWETTGTALSVVAQGSGKALALTGTATVKNVKIPKNITAGDSYAKQQAWEVSFTLSGSLTAGKATLFNNLIKLENNKLYYSKNGTFVSLASISAGKKYTVKVDNDLAANTATYTLSVDSAVVAQAKNVAVAAVNLPVSTIGFSSTGLTTKVYLDDYKLYPTGLANDFELYNGKTGIQLTQTEKNGEAEVAYRLSWMNATDTGRKVNVKVSYYNNSGSLLSTKILRTLEMAPGCDGVETGIVKNTTGKITVFLEEVGGYTPPTPTEAPVVAPTTAPTTKPTAAPTTRPTTAPTTKPTAAPVTTPSTPVVRPTNPPATTPSTPVVRPTNPPATTPSTPVVQPTNPPATTPSTPVVQPTNLPATTPSTPVVQPTDAPVTNPSTPIVRPTNPPATNPSTPVVRPTNPLATNPTTPGVQPTDHPGTNPSTPIVWPTNPPATNPTTPGVQPTDHPGTNPSTPVVQPTDAPATNPSTAPGVDPTDDPNQIPTTAPTHTSTDAPTDAPAVVPTDAPAVAPTVSPENIITKLEITDGGITVVPDSLVQAGLTTPEAVKEAIVNMLTKLDNTLDMANIAHYDVTLQYSKDGGNTWLKADETHFPEGGKLMVMLPYPAGTDASYTFTVVHMFTSSAFGKNPGDVELPYVKNTADGIQFEVTGLSPITLVWTAPIAKNPGVPVIVWVAVALVVAAAAAGGIVIVKKKRAK